MSEHLEPGIDDLSEPDVVAAPALPGSQAPETAAEGTGHPVVDEVLRSMQDLQQRPVEEHVAIFEAAHERLRSALSDAGDRPDGLSGP